MPDMPADKHDLPRMLKEGVLICGDLKQILERELDVLHRGDIDNLEALIKEQLNVLEQLERIDTAIRSIYRRSDTGDSVGSLYSVYHDSLQACRDLNSELGLVVQYRVQHSRLALEVLTGQKNTGYCYTGSGMDQNSSVSNLLFRI
jgi:flagellar biosynthesis/type III secretory pathway chaperone